MLNKKVPHMLYLNSRAEHPLQGYPLFRDLLLSENQIETHFIQWIPKELQSLTRHIENQRDKLVAELLISVLVLFEY